MKPSSFTVILLFAIAMVIGTSLLPLVDVGMEPSPRMGKTLTVRADWPNVSAKVVEQNLTSPIEGMVSSLRDIEQVSSTSYFGRSEIVVKLKENADVSATRFEISSLLRQTYDRLPKGVRFPSLSGGEVATGSSSHQERRMLLTYQVNADMQPDLIKSYVEQNVTKPLEAVDGVAQVEITGTTERYVDISYDPVMLSSYGLTADDIADGIRNFIGRDEVIGSVEHETVRRGQERIALHLVTAQFEKSLERMPLKTIGGKTVYLNDLASFHYRDKDPDSYYRVNGLNTIYINVYIPADGRVVQTSDRVQRRMEELSDGLSRHVYFHLSYDLAKQQREETHKLVSRTLLSLFFLLLFVWVANRDLRYLLIISATLAANLLMAVICYWLFDLKLHVYSLAGITVSLGLVIDSTIVMADHYGYYHDRRSFMAILAAMLTTIGSLVVIFLLPKEQRENLYDFAWIVIVNLAVSLLVALFFVPALMDRMHYTSHRRRLRHGRAVVRWNRFYRRYLSLTQRHKWICYVLLVLAFGLPFHALPERLGDEVRSYSSDDEARLPWYDRLYNSTLGSDFFQTQCKERLAMVMGGSMRLFAQSLDESRDRRYDDREKELHIMGRMPLGGTATQLNQKMTTVEEFLKGYKEIREFETRIQGGYGEIVVKFRKNVGSFPYRLENDVIGKVISVGGADWSTYGVSERGFSNALDLQHRSERITISGYNYDRLYRLAEQMADYMGENKRVQDLTIETPGHENQEDELYMRYHDAATTLYGVEPTAVHRSLRQMLTPTYVGYYKDRYVASDVYLRPVTADRFDLWHVENGQVRVDTVETAVPELMTVARREAKNIIPKNHQEYVLNVAFNILGSYSYSSDYIEKTVKHFNRVLPVGYRCETSSFGIGQDQTTQYLLILVIVAVIFSLCAIQFESFRTPFVIISILPVSFIGTFLTFYFTKVEFGTGGFASLVLLTGIVVNSGIYIISQYRGVLRSRSFSAAGRSSVDAYVCAYNHKVVPVLLTVFSSLLGLVPFFFDGTEEPFWFSFATGVTGGLLFSIPSLVFVMPIFMRLSCASSQI